MERVPVRGRTRTVTDGTGLFAAALMRQYPSLPAEEEGRLNNPHLRQNFVERVFAYRRLRSFFALRWTLKGLLHFHAAHKLVLLAHSPQVYRELDSLIATRKRLGRDILRDRYEAGFMRTLKKLATTGRHVKVLHHMLGCLRPYLDGGSRDDLVTLIEDYSRGLVPLLAPIALFRHYARRFDIAYLRGQVYLEPHPKELMLRYHA
jgi:uncharacterized protein YbgA (DUF1722 family)